MADIPNLPKKEWPDGVERVCTGCLIVLKTEGRYGNTVVVHESPKEVRDMMMKAKPKAMLTLHHHADPATEVFVRNNLVVALDSRWEKVMDYYD